MPELPDVTVYVEQIAARTVGQELRGVRLKTPFLVRTFAPPLSSTFGKKVVAVRRLGKRIVMGLEGDLFLVIHLMIAGRFRWKPVGAPIPGKLGLASFDFPNGALLLTEASTRKRASLHVVQGEEALRDFQRGGIEVEGATLDAFRDALVRENHTVKRALTDPRLFSGIGNAYSDEILHAARLSPVKRTSQLKEEEVKQLFEATKRTLALWTNTLRDEAKNGFPEKVTAFREGMAVHGKHGQPCPVCHAPVQRIVYADNETNYCARCQTGGKVLADRALSRLLHEDWPRTLEELEEIRPSGPSRNRVTPDDK
ncbi:MAG TPA: DNA-formamidopyrimidine glycosylase family protein [Polyangiaceae bacterium]|nr:DNA-formamidopyrimidine glycosylase family protein [Polyangiaceae bacterium]